MTSSNGFTAPKAAERKIEHMARHDPLTELPNRTLFGRRLKSDLPKLDDMAGLLRCFASISMGRPCSSTAPRAYGALAVTTLLAQTPSRRDRGSRVRPPALRAWPISHNRL